MCAIYIKSTLSEPLQTTKSYRISMKIPTYVEIQVQFASTCLLFLFMEQRWTGWSGSVSQDPSPSILIGKVFGCLLIGAVAGKAFGDNT